MRKTIGRYLKNRRGSVLAILAVFLPATLGTMALAIDLGMLFQARVQAQRAADSGALAGASAYRDFPNDPVMAADSAEGRARQFAALNDIRGTSIDPNSEVYVELRPNLNQVYVHVHRNDIPTWFARFLGIVTDNVAAGATAQARTSGGVNCLRPLALPDIWHDGDQDLDGDRIWDPGESWQFDSENEGGPDRYSQYRSGNAPETGFGSEWRDGFAGPVDNDYGLQITLKQPQGNPQNTPTEPGWFYPLALPGGTGASWYRGGFTTCRPGTFFVGQPITNEPGAMIGPTEFGIADAIATDPNSRWDSNINDIVNSNYVHHTDNPRVLLLALFDPHDLDVISGRGTVIPNNFAHFYLEGFRDPNGVIHTTQGAAERGHGNYKAPVVGRFMYYAQGAASGGPAGPLVLQLRLVPDGELGH